MPTCLVSGDSSIVGDSLLTVCSHGLSLVVSLFLFFFYIFKILFLLLFKYSCLHFPATTFPYLPPSILTPFGFGHGSFIHVPYWLFCFFPLMVIAAQFTIAKCWKQPTYPAVNEWIKKLWYIYTMEYHTTERKKELCFPQWLH